MLVKSEDQISQLNELNAVICWMEETPMVTEKMYLLQHGVNRVKAKISSVQTVLDIRTLESHVDKKIFGLNDIGEVSLRLAKPIFADTYEYNPANGSFILIDEFSHNTVAVGFIKK